MTPQETRHDSLNHEDLSPPNTHYKAWEKFDQKLNVAVNIGQFLAWAAAIGGVIWAWVNPGAVANYMVEVQRFAAEANAQLESIDASANTTAKNTTAIAESSSEISKNASILARSVAVWPTFSSLGFEFSPPTKGAFSIRVENPRNVVVRDFQAFIRFGGSLEGVNVALEGGKIIPPNESYILFANIIRENWFEKQYLNYDGQKLSLCISGLVEGDSDTFFESRSYSANSLGEVGSLLDRSFSIGKPSDECS